MLNAFGPEIGTLFHQGDYIASLGAEVRLSNDARCQRLQKKNKSLDGCNGSPYDPESANKQGSGAACLSSHVALQPR